MPINPQKSGQYRFAIVEDEPAIAQLVNDMLLSSGAKVEVFTGSAAFLKSTNLLQFRSVVLDLSLPDVDGFELMEMLATKSKGMSVVLMSGHDIAIVRAAKVYGNAIGLNVRAALTKPFSRDELFAGLGLSI